MLDVPQFKTSLLKGVAWRVVEAQHIISTNKLVDTLDEQEILENILEESKPKVPDECSKLDYLLSTPFRYVTYKNGSRFRREGKTPGVWYGAEYEETAIAETIFYRFLFISESPETSFELKDTNFTAFSAQISTKMGLDLTQKEHAIYLKKCSHLTYYSESQLIAAQSREAGIEIIKYLSVRDPNRFPNLAVLNCNVFTSRKPTNRHTWRISFFKNVAHAHREHPRKTITFKIRDFNHDPRINIV